LRIFDPAWQAFDKIPHGFRRPKMRFEKCTRFEQLVRVRNEWNELLAKSDADRLFLSFDWVETWWEHFGGRYELLTHLLYEKDQLVGILPLMCRTKEGFREMAILGVGRSDYLDFILHPLHVEACIECFLEEVLRKTDGWDIFHSTRLIEHKATLDGLLKLVKRTNNHQYFVRDFGAAPYIQIKGDWNAYLMSVRNKQHVSQKLRQLEEKKGRIRFRKITSADQFEQVYTKLVSFHKFRWDHTKKCYSMFNEHNMVEFYRAISLKALTNQSLHVGALVDTDEVLALDLGFVLENKFYYLISAINWDYARFSVGRIHLLHLLEEAFREHYSEFDFCYGDESYKYDYASTERKLKEIVIANNTMKGKLAFVWSKTFHNSLKQNRFFMDKAMPRLKSLGVIKEVS
jgi:CelD/BcsL family acetyltransferase involved in cellulose biosynthesis